MQNHNDGASTSSGISDIDELLYKTVTFKKPPKNIIITKTTLADQKAAKKELQQTILRNKSDQQRIDNDILLSGFSSTPKVEIVLKKLMELINMPLKSAKLFHHFESRSIHHVVITFKDYSTKVQFLNMKALMKHPLRLNQLTDQPLNGEQSNPIITCVNRLTRFNYAVEKQLYKLKSHFIVDDIKFADSLFHFNVKARSEWKTVTNLEILHPYNEVLIVRNKEIAAINERFKINRK